jgi:hypothetical protein
MSHLVSHGLIRFAVYPALYWIGFATIKGLSMGNAIIMPYSELGAEEDAAWWEFRIRRESMIIIGGCFVLLLVSGYYVCRYML